VTPSIHTESSGRLPAAASVTHSQSPRSRWLIPGLFAATAVAIALSLRNAAPLVALLAACVWVVTIAVFRARSARVPSNQTVLVLALCGLPVALLGITSALAVNPRVALLGAVGQHVGAATWLIAFLLLVVTALVARPTDLGDVARAGAGLGVLVSVAAVLDWVGLLSGARFSAEASGVMENSIALGQLLVLSLACSFAWLVSTRIRAQRVVAGAATVIVLAGLLVADSAAAWIGVTLGASACALVWWAARRGSVRPFGVAAVAAILIIVAIPSLWLALPDGADVEAWLRIANLTNDRSVIWTSALKQITQAPIAGSGAEHFSAWVVWSSRPGVDLQQTATYDPHNIVLWWLLSAGILGALAAIGAAAALLWSLLDRARQNPRAPVFAALVGGAVGWAVSVMFGWINPLALAMLALLVGAALGATGTAEGGAQRFPVARVVVIAGGVLAVGVVLLLAVFGASAEIRWARGVDRGDLDGRALQAAFAQTEDPTYAALLAGSGATAGQVEGVDRVIRRDSVWHVDAALARVALAGDAVVTAGDSAATDALAEAVLSARMADPASGLWGYVAAVYSEGSGDADRAAGYAEAALAFPMPPDIAAYLEGLLHAPR